VPQTNSEFIHLMWTFTGGAILVLIQSLVSGVKRRWFSLLVGCMFGGAGAVIGWGVLQEFKFGIYVTVFLSGVAAVVAENVVAGFLNMSKQFADNPIAVFSHFAKMFLPAWGKTVGDSSIDEKLK
jgi:hypothetical protein